MGETFEHDAIIIGAGPNGLTAAAVLAQTGWSVLVLEAQDTIGGGARSRECTLPGFVHDVCSAIHPLGVTSPAFRALNLEAHGVEWIHPPHAAAHPFDDGTAAVLDRAIALTSESFGAKRDQEHYQRLITPLADAWESLAGELLAPLHLPRHPVLLARFIARGIRSCAGLLRGRFNEERARGLIAGMCAHSILPLESRPSAGIGLVLMAAGHAVGWPIARGGSQTISDALASIIRSGGGEIRINTSVARMRDLPPARTYLFDTAPRNLARIAGDALPARYRRKLERFRHGPGVFKIDWALSDPIPWKAESCSRAGTIHVGGTYEEIAASERAIYQNEHTERPFVLIAQQSLFDSSRAPARKHTGWGYCHVPHGSKLDLTERIEAQVERYAPGFRDCIIARHTRSAAQMESANANYLGGDISGGVSDLRQLLARPTFSLCPYATPNPKIFLCSASTPPGGGVHGLCGWHAAHAVLRRDAKIREIA